VAEYNQQDRQRRSREGNRVSAACGDGHGPEGRNHAEGGDEGNVHDPLDRDPKDAGSSRPPGRQRQGEAQIAGNV